MDTVNRAPIWARTSGASTFGLTMATKTSKRHKPLTQWQKEDAARLKALFANQRLSQEAFGERHHIGTQGVVWQYLNGKIPLNLNAALKFARGIGCDVAEFSPRLAEQLPPADQTRRTPGAVLPIGSDEAVISVPVLDVHASMGLGEPMPVHDTVVDHMRLTSSWVQRNLPTISRPKNLSVISAYGDSMNPTFADGDILLVDRGVQDLKVDAVYVLSYRGELYIKRVQRRLDGTVAMMSDNKLYEPYVISGEDRENLQVLGRVLWAWNGKRL